MDWFIIALGVIYVIIIIAIYFRYNKDATPYKKIEYYRDSLEINPSEAAYLLNPNSESISLILADLLSLVNKKQLKLDMNSISESEKEYIFYRNPKIDFTTMKNHEAMSYKLFFDMNEGKDKVYLDEFLTKLENNKNAYKEFEVKCYAIKESIKTELEKQGITDGDARRKMRKIHDRSVFWGILVAILLVIAIIVKNTVLTEITYITTAFIFMLYHITDREEHKITPKGAEILEKARALKRYIKDYILTEDKPIYTVNILDYYYTMAIAFNMAHIGKEEFYQDSLAVAQRRKVWEHIKRNKKKYITTFMVLAFLAWAWYYIYTTLGEEYNYIILAFVTLMIGLVLDDNASKK